MVDELKKQIESLKKSLDAARTHARSLQRQLQDAEKSNALLSHRLKDSEIQTERLLREKFGSTKRVAELEKRLGELRQKSASQHAADQFKQERDAFVQQLNELQEQTDKYGEDLWQSRQLASTLEERLRQVQLENADVRTAFESAAEQASRYQSLRDEAVMSTQQLQQSQMELEQQIESIQGSAETSVRSTTGKLLETRRQLLDLQAKFDEQSREFEDWKRNHQAKSSKRKAKEKARRQQAAKNEASLKKKLARCQAKLQSSQSKDVTPRTKTKVDKKNKLAKKISQPGKSEENSSPAQSAGSRRSNVDQTKRQGKQVSSRSAGKKHPKLDDLKRIEGIGPKTETVLQQAGVDSFIKLAKMKEKRLKEILREAGPRFSIHNPRSWPRQARLAARGKWDELQKLQDDIVAGRA